jgi:hypothetical protein
MVVVLVHVLDIYVLAEVVQVLVVVHVIKDGIKFQIQIFVELIAQFVHINVMYVLLVLTAVNVIVILIYPIIVVMTVLMDVQLVQAPLIVTHA